MILGTISAIDDDNGLQLIIDGEDSPTTKKYSYLSSYVPSADDRVLIEEIGGSYVILGTIITDVASSGIVRQATNATNAVNATSADNALHADSATTATNATNATNATSASMSDKTKGFDYTVPSYGGYLVSRVDSQYVSEIGMNVVTGVWLGNYANFTYKQ